MKNIVLASALIASVAAPAFAEGVKAPGFANSRAAEIHAQLTLESDGFNEGLSKYVVEEAVSPSNISVSSSNVSNLRAAEIFAELAAADHGRNAGLPVDGAVTSFDGGAVNARAAAIFEALDLADDED
jgi:hypothetical protein